MQASCRAGERRCGNRDEPGGNADGEMRIPAISHWNSAGPHGNRAGRTGKHRGPCGNGVGRAGNDDGREWKRNGAWWKGAGRTGRQVNFGWNGVGKSGKRNGNRTGTTTAEPERLQSLGKRDGTTGKPSESSGTMNAEPGRPLISSGTATMTMVEGLQLTGKRFKTSGTLRKAGTGSESRERRQFGREPCRAVLKSAARH